MDTLFLKTNLQTHSFFEDMTTFTVQTVIPDSEYEDTIKVMYNQNMNPDYVKILYDVSTQYHKQTIFQDETFVCYRHIMDTLEYINNHMNYMYHLCENKALIYIDYTWYYIGDIIWDMITNPTRPLDNYKQVDGVEFPYWCVNRVNEEVENVRKNHNIRNYRIIQSNNETHMRFSPYITDIVIDGKVYYTHMDDKNHNNMEID